MSSLPEAEWDDTEREWMLALAHYRQHVLCPCGCGWAREISMAPEGDYPIDVEAPSRCHVRTALVKAQQEGGRDTPEALLWTAKLAEPVT